MSRNIPAAEPLGTPPTKKAQGVSPGGSEPIDDVLNRLALARGRRIHLVPLNLTGLWLTGARAHARDGDVIFYDDRADAAERDRIVREQLDALLRDPVNALDTNLPEPRKLIEHAITRPALEIVTTLGAVPVHEGVDGANGSARSAQRLPTQPAQAR